MPTPTERATSFGVIADDYNRLRPGPPDAALDWLLPADCQVAVDVGAGTGLLTRALARRVTRVVAVEPDDRMRAVLQARSPGVAAVAGTGEAIPLPDASADGVFVSSAWHWMDPERAVPEVARVLRDGGRFGVIWTSRDRQVDWVRDLRWPGDAAAAAPGDRAEAGRPGIHAVSLPEGAPLRDISMQTIQFTLTMSVTSLVELVGTYSGVITASPQDREAALAHARAVLAERFPGATQIEVPMRSWCWRADRVPRP